MNKRKTRGGGPRESGMRDRGLGGAATSPSERRSDGRPSGGPRDNKDMGGVGGREETEGVYKNARLMHTFTSLIGAPLRVELQSAKIFEGILTTFSPACEAVLEQVHEVEPSNPDLVNVNTVQLKVVFPMKDVVQFCVMNTDLTYASKEDFQTDAQIAASKQNGEAPMKQLEEWIPEEGDGGDGGLDDGGVGGVGGGGGSGNSNGWSVHEMFAKNAEFGVETSYDPKLRGYTTELKGADNDDWREKQRQAARIAAEIEGSERSQKQLALEVENGDEEELFSAVHRDQGRRSDPRQGADKENWREERRGGGGGGRDDRGRGSRGGGRGGSRTTPPGNRSTPPPSRYGEHGEEQGSGFRGERRGGYDREGRGGGRGGYEGGRHEGGGGRYNDARNYDYRGDERRGGGGGGGRDFRDDRRSDGGRGAGASFRNQQGGQQQQQQDGAGNKGAHQEKKSSPLPPGGQEDQGRRKSDANNRESGGGRQQQAEQRSPGEPDGTSRAVQNRKDKTREQTNHDLKDFNQKFHLAAEDTNMRTSTTPSVSVKATGATLQPLPSPSSQQQPAEPPSPAPAPSPQTQPSPQAPSAATTPAPEVKKSTLNPNAKEFSLNPTAKEFTPRPARVAPTPPRPQTPNTPQGGPIPGQPYQGYMLAPGPGQQLAMSHVNPSTPVFMQHPALPGSGTTQFLPRGGAPPHQNRGGPGGKDSNQQNNLPRPDLPSPMAVTGHPILAAPGLNPGQPPHGQPYFSPHPGQQVYSQPGQVIRMMVPAGMPGGAMMPGMVPVMTSHSGETPGGHQHSSGSQGHHQQMWGGTPSPHPPHLATATPPTQPQPPPSATPPQPSPGLYQHPQPSSLPPQGYPGQPMFVIPGGGMVPTTMAGPGAGHPAHLIGQQSPQYYAGPGGQPVTSMGGYMINPQFQHIQHQGQPGHLPLHMQPQQPPPQQPPPQQQQQQLNQ